MENNIRFVLKPEYQEEIFTQLLDQYDKRFLDGKLCLKYNTIYHYRNNRIRSISSSMFDQIIWLLQPKIKDLLNNIVTLHDYNLKVHQTLDEGRELRKKQIIQIKESIPLVSEIFSSTSIDFERWFVSYIKLSFSGVRIYEEIVVEGDKIVACYSNYSKSVKKNFIQSFPRKIFVDEDFQYFFGLWVGDRIGKGRFGVVNKNKIINLETSRYLKKLHQEPIFDLHMHEKASYPELDFPIHKIYVQKSTPIKGSAVWVYSQNATLFTFFDYLAKDLDYILSLLPNKAIFFAGLFDAEGNVNLQDNCLKWACKDLKKVSIYEKHLRDLNLFKRYDGTCLICPDPVRFDALIFPYVKHLDKRKDFDFMLFRSEELPSRYYGILETIEKHQAMAQKNLAKALNRVKIYGVLGILEKHGYIITQGYPYKIFLTEKGFKELESGGKDKK